MDLLQTFNWLIGLTVQQIAAPWHFAASLRRDDDPNLPMGAPRRLLLDARLREVERLIGELPLTYACKMTTKRFVFNA